MIRLGVNIDHIATLRQARLTQYPEPVHAALLVEQAGADSITVHLREDRRHIHERDVRLLKEVLSIPLNLEMAVTEEMLRIAEALRPRYCCLVPENRQELTTEGGLDVIAQKKKVSMACERLNAEEIEPSLFIDADEDQIEAALVCGAKTVEIHTGAYAEAETPAQAEEELKRIMTAARFADNIGLQVNAGHGLNYQNVQALAATPLITEVNIGHSIIARAVFTGLEEAVREMKHLLLGQG